MRYALALLATLFLAMPASAQWGNVGVQVVVPAPGGGGVSVGYNNGYYNPGYYNAGYNAGYYNPGYNAGYYYNTGGGYYNNGYRPNYYNNSGYTTYNRYPYTPYQQVWGGGGGHHHGHGRCR